MNYVCFLGKDKGESTQTNSSFFFSEKKYLAFLHSCYFDVELAVKTIKSYYKYHFEVPQVFCDLDPLSKDIENNYDCV